MDINEVFDKWKETIPEDKLPDFWYDLIRFHSAAYGKGSLSRSGPAPVVGGEQRERPRFFGV